MRNHACGVRHVDLREVIDLIRPAFLAGDRAFREVHLEHRFEKGKQTSVQHASQGE